ncbi:MAG: choice-of-anchor D domain-containing protein [Proteobacteria bacterium]|nr:choice-of-anchor D domain-containing protein [Pseudomonadota bacterium]MCP4916104.1 choice-of-anchor D domain-containing protein [Pseudomonadota bacterium]
MKLRSLIPLGVLPIALLGCEKETQEYIEHDYPEMVISSDRVEFGLVAHGETETRQFTIQNTGDLTMGVSSVAEGLGRDEDFDLSYDEANITCPELEDTGEAAAEAKDASPPPALVLETSELDFGAVTAGSNAVLSFNMTNTGNDPLIVTTASVTPGDSPFAILGTLAGVELLTDESTEVYVSYSPTVDTGDTATLILVTNDPTDGGVAIVGLLGNQGGSTGDSGDSDPTDTNEPVDTDDPTTADDQVLFTLDGGCKIPVDVTFTPINVGEIRGSIIVDTWTQVVEDGEPEYYADLDEKRAIVFLDGEAEKGEGRAIVKPRTLDFGHVWSGLDEVKYLEVANAGDGDLELYPPQVDDACDEDFSITWSYAEDGGDPKVLSAGTQTFLEITYTPTDTSASYCTVTVLSDDGDYPDISVNVQGNSGKDPENEPPSVVIRSPDAGYVHATTDDISMELNIFDVNQPATSLSCRVKSMVQLGATITTCSADDDSGHVLVDVPLEYLDPGIDTFLVEVIDGSASSSFASIPVILMTSADEHDDDGDGYGEVQYDTGDVFDCDDGNINTYPKAAEISDGEDNDCDGDIDEGTTGSDDDGDAFTEEQGDCDDADLNTYPGAPEAADRRDNDCDGIIDEQTTLYDDDGDGYAEVNLDCNDLEAEINPGAIELCDDVDNDCNGLVDDACLEVNSDPMIIGGINMGQSGCEVSETIQMSVEVFEADGQDVTYLWTHDEVSNGGVCGGFDNQNAASVSWTAPPTLANDVGALCQVYVIATDTDGNQVWDFDEVEVYPEDTLYQKYIEVVTIPKEGCMTGGGFAGFGAMVLAAGMVARRRREED